MLTTALHFQEMQLRITEHIHLSTDTTIQSVIQLKVMYEELGKKLQHYQDTASVPFGRQPSSHIRLKGDTQTVISPKDLPYIQHRDFKVQAYVRFWAAWGARYGRRRPLLVRGGCVRCWVGVFPSSALSYHPPVTPAPGS